MEKWRFSHAVLIHFSCFLFAGLGADVITSTQFISDAKNQSILSSNGSFCLGFFSPGNSSNRYVGIWFAKVSTYQTVVWVANRNAPLRGRHGIFKIDGDGNLAVFDGNNGGNPPLWYRNVSIPAGGAGRTAKLLESSELVLTGTNGTVVWRSSEEPTDTALPGITYRFDGKTRRTPFLNSWRSENDPVSGDFSLRVDLTGLPQLFLYNKSTPYWRGGPWNGESLSGVPNPSLPPSLPLEISGVLNFADFLRFRFIPHGEGVNFSYSTSDSSILTRIVLEPSGTIRRYIIWFGVLNNWTPIWTAPEEQCDMYARCSASQICRNGSTFDCSCLSGFSPLSTQGPDDDAKCVKILSQSACGKGRQFGKLSYVKLPDARTAKLFANLSLDECHEECCNRNCSGYAAADVSPGGRGCFAWYGELNDMTQRIANDSAVQDFFIRLEGIHAGGKNRHGLQGTPLKLVIILPTVAPGLLLLISCSCCLWRKYASGLRRRQRCQQMVPLGSETLASSNFANLNGRTNNRNIELELFDLETVITATENFSPARKIGHGGFGSVYKGELPSGQEIAVKRLSKNSGQGIIEFKTEALLIAKLQHRNLVRLLGCCTEDDEKILIYEYMPNKSLDNFIFNQSSGSIFDWKKRHEIILGIARGILYLHQDSRLRIVHRDLKASNILLDGDLNPKISDFGTARIFEGNQDEANTRRVVGTLGYMSPEYALYGQFSVKSDVFSFGVLLLEIVSGKKNMAFFHGNPSSNLIEHTWKLWESGRTLEVMDALVVNSCSREEVLRCIEVGLLCVQDNVADRPTMSSVVYMLSEETIIPPPPKEPTFAMRRDATTMATTLPSINELTLSEPEAR